MAIIYIAFIECVLDTHSPSSWETVYGFPQRNNPTTHAVYNSLVDGSKLALVDIKGNRRYFSFDKDAEVHIINNTVVFDSNSSEEDAVNENIQFPQHPRINE